MPRSLGIWRRRRRERSSSSHRKSAAWWALNQDERREIFEAKSQHIAGSLKYLPQVARQLYPDNWRDRMQDVVDVAIAMHRKGEVLVVQHGEPVDVNQIKGPIRIKTN